MRVEIRLQEATAKSKGYPFGDFYNYLNSYIPGLGNTCVVVWSISTELTSKNSKILVFTADINRGDL